MKLSPELDLLEQLTGGDMPLRVASMIFPDPERFRKVVEIYVRSGAVRLIRRSDEGERSVQPWELRQLMNDPELWTQQPGRDTGYHLRLTPEGHEQFAGDSQGFFNWLFGK